MKVMLAMSGGVDSSVAGALLIEEGHHVVGVTMKLWGGESDTGCCSVSDVDDARRVAQQLDIDHLVFNFGDDFNEHVVAPYVAAHTVGVTPNPCIECNRHVKFSRMLHRADQLGFDAIATGHHARVEQNGDAFRLVRGVDAAKDQSYVVHMLDQDTLSRTLFPVGHIDKAEVRRRAEEMGLRTASKPDSQDVCFITSTGGREAFLGHRIPFRRAEVVDRAGEQLGHVEAVELVTIGQRRGLGLPGGGPKRYVTDIDMVASKVVLGDDIDLHDAGITAAAVSWVDQAVSGRVLVQCSAHGSPRPATIVAAEDDQGRAVIEITWRQPERRIANGQSVVFYDPTNRCVLGGGLAAGWQHALA